MGVEVAGQKLGVTHQAFPAYLPTHIPCLPAPHLPPTCPPPSLPTCPPTSPAYLPTHLPSCLFPAYLPPYLPSCLSPISPPPTSIVTAPCHTQGVVKAWRDDAVLLAVHRQAAHLAPIATCMHRDSGMAMTLPCPYPS